MAQQDNEQTKGNTTVKAVYVPLVTEKITVVLESGVCATSYVVKDDVSQNGDASISQQEKGGDGFEFEFDSFD